MHHERKFLIQYLVRVGEFLQFLLMTARAIKSHGLAPFVSKILLLPSLLRSLAQKGEYPFVENVRALT